MWKIFKKPFEVFEKLYFSLNLLPHLSKKQTFFVSAIFIFIILACPSKAYAFAFIPIIVIPLVTAILTGAAVTAADLATKAMTFLALTAGLVTVILLFGFIHLRTGSTMLHWAMGNPLGSLTNPVNNDIIRIGWTALRDLTNMFFVLGLAYIGLATALDISNKFRTGKTFAKLLLFALLINFTPVICGVVVDAANIISDFFLSSVDFSTLSDAYGTAKLTFIGITKDTIFGETIWTEFLVLTTYAFIGGTVLWLFALLFLMRIFIIWILVIISPLAFFAGIFDETKKHFDSWWSMFTKWSFVAVPAGFFLYLSHHLLVAALRSKIAQTGDVGFFGRLTPYLIAVVFMCIGFQATRKINVAGSAMIIGATNKAIGRAKALPGVAGKFVKKKTEKEIGTFIGGAVAAAGGVAGGASAARQQHIAAGKEAGKGFFARRAGATRAAFRGALTREGREEGTRITEESREKLYGWAERHHLAPAGTYEEQREKRLDVGGAQKRGQKMTEERINAQLAVEATQPKHIAEQLGLIRAKIEEKHELTERDLEILLKHGYLDGGKTKWQAILGPRPDWEAILAPQKAQEKAIERLTGWTKEERETEHKRLITEGATEEGAQEKIKQREGSAFKGSMTKAEAETQLKEDRERKLEEETQNIIRQGETKGETIDDKFRKKAAKQAELNLRMEAPHIEQDIKIEITQERIDKMSDKKIGELQINNLNLLMALDEKHIKTLAERATLKQLRKIDDLLIEEKAKGENSEFLKRIDGLIKRSDDTNLSQREQDRCLEKGERLLAMVEAAVANPRFLYEGAGSEETAGEAEERQRREREEETEEETEAEEMRRRESEQETTTERTT